MDTSDSEGCFESADEDFHSEDEAIGRHETSNKKKDNNLKKHESSTESRPEFGIPPMISVCWEPGMELIEHNGELRPVFPDPPARVECWESGVEQNVSECTNKNSKTNEAGNQGNFHSNLKSEFGIAVSKEPPKEIKTLSKDEENTKENDNEIISRMEQVDIVDKKNNNIIEEGNTLLKEDIDKKVAELKNIENKVEIEENNEKGSRSKFEEGTKNKNGDCLSEEKIGDTNKCVDTLQDHEKEKWKTKEIAKTNMFKEKEIIDNKFQDTRKVTVDEPSQKDLWNEDDGWGWNEEEEEKGSNFHSFKSSKRDIEVSSQKGKQDTYVDEKKQKNDTQSEKKIFSTTCNTKKEQEDMWEGDAWNENVDDGCKSYRADKLPNEENLWGDDEDWLDNSNTKVPNTNVENNKKQDISKALENLTASPSQESSWGGWGNWGISSVLSTAANITSSVSQGITTALESGIGVPDPEELARLHKAEQNSSPQSLTTEPPPVLTFGLNNLVSGVSTITKLVETTSTKVISGGLDTLESIGKKTMEVLQENDPGLKKKRAFLKIEQDKPVLSQILREAKEKAEEENKEREKLHYTKKANYETIFDDHQGLVHLEALEMLSKQCEIKLQSVISKSPPDTMADLQETLDQVKELCELLEEDEDEGTNIEEIKEKIDSAIGDIKVPINYVKLLERWGDTELWLLDLEMEKVGENEVHQYAIETLAELTALSVEQFHKAGELLLVKEHRSTADEADSLVQLTTVLTGLISIAASKFSEKLNSHPSHSENKEVVNSQITNVFLEAANSSRYIQDAFQLLIPVLQVGAV